MRYRYNVGIKNEFRIYERYDRLQQENEDLKKEVARLKSKIQKSENDAKKKE